MEARRGYHKLRCTWGAPGGEERGIKPSGSPDSLLWAKRVAKLGLGLVLMVFTCTTVQAQGGLSVDPSGRSGDAPPPLLKEPPPPPGWTLPPLPPPSTGEAGQLPSVRVLVRQIRVTGSTAFSAEELAGVTAPYVNRELTSEDLEALRLALTLHYVNRGYINSGAILPDQTVSDGVITLQVIEGKLAQVEVEGNRWFRPGYLRDRLALGAGSPLNINALQQRMQLLQQDGRIQRFNAELSPGLRPGEGVLRVWTEEERPYKAWLELNNYQSPTVGAERGLITLAHQNLTGYGDTLSVRYGRSEGIDPQVDARYTLPLTARDTTLTLQYRKNDFAVQEEPFSSLDIDSESEIYGATLRHPLYRTLNRELALSLALEHLRTRTYLLGRPFSFSEGARDGRSTVTALRLSQEWVSRTQSQVIAAHSRFTLGMDAWGATNNDSAVADGRFFAWLGQFQWARRLGAGDAQVIGRMDLQLANDPLLPIEQMAIGGRYSVRGYRENQMVRDNGLVASLELHIPLVRNRRWAELLQLVPFMDLGRAWNRKTPTPAHKTIASTGLGLSWTATLTYPFRWRPQIEVYWGAPWRNINHSNDDLQDNGVHLQLGVALF